MDLRRTATARERKNQRANTDTTAATDTNKCPTTGIFNSIYLALVCVPVYLQARPAY